MPNGGIDMSKLCYKVEGDPKTGFITMIIFTFNGDQVDVSDQQLNDTHQIINNESMWRAALQRLPFPPLKMCTFFKRTRAGPWKLGSSWVATSVEYAAMATQVKSEFDRAQAAIHGDKKDDKIAKQIQDLAKAKKQATMTKAREQAALKVAEKKAKRVVNLKIKH